MDYSEAGQEHYSVMQRYFANSAIISLALAAGLISYQALSARDTAFDTLQKAVAAGQVSLEFPSHAGQTFETATALLDTMGEDARLAFVLILNGERCEIELGRDDARRVMEATEKATLSPDASTQIRNFSEICGVTSPARVSLSPSFSEAWKALPYASVTPAMTISNAEAEAGKFRDAPALARS